MRALFERALREESDPWDHSEEQSDYSSHDYFGKSYDMVMDKFSKTFSEFKFKVNKAVEMALGKQWKQKMADRA